MSTLADESQLELVDLDLTLKSDSEALFFKTDWEMGHVTYIPDEIRACWGFW